jgi:hypothetical protein
MHTRWETGVDVEGKGHADVQAQPALYAQLQVFRAVRHASMDRVAPWHHSNSALGRICASPCLQRPSPSRWCWRRAPWPGRRTARCWSERVTRYVRPSNSARCVNARQAARVRARAEGRWLDAGDSHHGMLRRCHCGRRLVHPAHGRACGAQVGRWPHVVSSPPSRTQSSSTWLLCHVDMSTT